MSTVLRLANSPMGCVLWKWTVLLALGWAVHGLLRRGHARWRLILWRSILIFSLALPLASLLSLPALTIPIHPMANEVQTDMATASLASTTKASPTESPSPKSSGQAALTSTAVTRMKIASEATASKPFPWKTLLWAVWVFGCICGTLRLIWHQTRLAGLRRRSEGPGAALVQLARETAARLNMRRSFRLRICGATHSPFVCGLWQPTILLPQRLVGTLSADETAALLRHEMAHLRGRDLWWSTGWRWLQVIGWFLPLIWRVSAAHGLACEQEADRVASGRAEEHKSYAQLLAQLTLRVLALPAVETKMTLNGTAQIVRRLEHLQRKGAAVWKGRHTVIGFGLATLLFLIAVGCRLVESNPAADNPSARQFKEVTVEVRDQHGKPIEGASIAPFGFRVKGRHAADAYIWRTNVFGPKVTVHTGADGKAILKYPVMGIPEEKEYTGALIFTVMDPEYSTVMVQDYPVDETNAPIQMTRGITLEVSAYYGADHLSVTNLVPNLADEGVRPDDWRKEADGDLVCHKLSPGGHLIQLMGRLPSGEIVYSDTAVVTAETGKVSRLALEMKPGIRLAGRLDDRVPRPVENGRVMMDVRPPEYPATNGIEDFYALDSKYGGRHFWHSYRPINADGTFVFESVPPGEADVVVWGDGFAAKCEGQLYNRVNGALKKGPRIAIPQAFPLTAPVTRITVKTEPTATLEFRATTRSGKPIDDVWVGMWVSAFRMRGLYGWKQQSSETPYRKIPRLPNLVFSGKTGPDGMLTIPNLPAEITGLDIVSAHYQVPLQQPKGWRDRHVRVRFEPGRTNQLDMILEPKGTDYIGTAN